MTVVVLAVAMMVIVTVRALAVVLVVTMPRLLLLLLLPVMRRGLVMLPQQIEPVIVAVRRSHDGVHVEFRRLRVGQKHAGVVVELDEGDRALHPVVERARLAEAA